VTALQNLTGCQRWLERKALYRRIGEAFRASAFVVEELVGDTTAKQFVIEHHYSASYPAARFRFGLYERGTLVGVAVFSHPCRNEVLTSVFPGDPMQSAELGRFVLLDRVPGNGESWFLARCLEALAGRLRGVVSFSDPVPRQALDGRTVMPGHVGVIYQASNATYCGRSTARTLRLLPDGSVFSDRAAQKIRKLERGWEYAAAQLVAHGADARHGDPREWLRWWLPRVTRTFRHPGNHRYAFGLRRSVKRSLPASLPYPKAIERRAAV